LTRAFFGSGEVAIEAGAQSPLIQKNNNFLEWFRISV